MVDSTHPFLSTSSARRTTRQVRPAVRGRPISIHVLREEDDCDRGEVEPGGAYISIHVLREEDDQAGGDVVVPVGQFLSTSSARRTTAKTERKTSAFVQLYNTLHEMKRLKGEKTQNGLKIMQSCTLKPVRRVRGFCESLPFARASVQGA